MYFKYIILQVCVQSTMTHAHTAKLRNSANQNDSITIRSYVVRIGSRAKVMNYSI